MQGDNNGVVQKTIQELFKVNSHKRSYITANYVAVYNEKAYDLMNDAIELKIKNDSKGNPIFSQITKGVIESQSDLDNFIDEGNQSRQKILLSINTEDSRCHFMIQIEVELCDLFAPTNHVYSMITFLDLASSNRISKIGVTGQQMKECVQICKSLGCVLNTISALSSSTSHVPLRDCIITFILKSTLWHPNNISIIGNISAALSSKEESLSTIRAISKLKKPHFWRDDSQYFPEECFFKQNNESEVNEEEAQGK